MSYKNRITAFLSLMLIVHINAQYELTLNNADACRNYTTTQITFTLQDFDKSMVSIGGKEFLSISLKGAANSLLKGFPDIPCVNKPIIIPDDRCMQATILSAEYTDIAVSGIAPSKGIIYRDQEFDAIPYVFNEIYDQDQWYPRTTVTLGKAFIYRDFRGCLVQISPFQYNPVKKILRVYSRISVQVSAAGSSTENVLVRNRPIAGLDAEFNDLYAIRFLNHTQTRYPIISEDGAMLIISHADFLSTLTPFVEWKRRKGLKVEVVDAAKIGAHTDSIKSFISGYYNDPAKNLKYVLFVGDHELVPTNTWQNYYASDLSYAFQKGDDCYSEFLTGRFSGTTPQHIKTQVDRTIFYETSLKTTDTWLSTSLLSAGEGPSGPTKYLSIITDSYNTLTNAGYTNVLRYHQNGIDGSVVGNSTSISDAINKGISFWQYNNHGSKTSLPAVGFSITTALALNNQKRLFFAFAGACDPGQFNTANGDCLAEALMKAENNGQPVGTIGSYLSSITQVCTAANWTLEEVTKILAESYPNNKKYTLGGLMINGGMYALDMQNAQDVSDAVMSYVLFGDPNLQYYSKTPLPISVKHPASLSKTGLQTVTVTGTENARVCLYIPKQGTQSVGIIKNGTAAMQIDVKTNDSIYVTGMLQNHETYMGCITVGPTGISSSINNNSCFDFRMTNSGLVYHIPNHVSNDMGTVNVRVYTVQGELIFSIVKKSEGPGKHFVSFKDIGRDNAKGAYIVVISTQKTFETMKLILKQEK